MGRCCRYPSPDKTSHTRPRQQWRGIYHVITTLHPTTEELQTLDVLLSSQALQARASEETRSPIRMRPVLFMHVAKRSCNKLRCFESPFQLKIKSSREYFGLAVHDHRARYIQSVSVFILFFGCNRKTK